MSLQHINSRSLNLRNSPLIKPSTLIVSLPFGHAVDVKGPAEREGWSKVTTIYNQNQYSGVISSSYLRAPLSKPKEAILVAAAIEWDRFKRGDGKEASAPYSGYVGEMWEALGEKLTGENTEVPWSAAFISFVTRKAGYKKFKFAVAHAKYIHEAIVAREAKQAKDFWGFRLDEHKPAIGDLVCRKRSSAKITYDFARVKDDFQSHTDYVVATGDGFVDTVGGNVSNSVTITRYKLTPSGHLDADGGRVFAVLRNNN